MSNEENLKNNKSEIAKKEEEVLDFWNKNQIFQKTLDKDAPNGNFVFFDGPPFATGFPHYGHILPGTIKDIIPRYQTMKGKRVLRRWGWDCHGLPIENLVEKELGLKSKKDIEEYGVEKFNLASRNAVLRYADEWKKIIPRSGRWVDMENSYLTMQPSYTQSVWWSFKKLDKKGLVHQDFRSMMFCPHCETTLSNFEVNQGYRDITDISVYVEFELVDSPKTYLIAWTTTPWTLPGNVALAINSKVEYVEVEGEVEGNKYIVAKERLPFVFKTGGKIIRSVDPKEILGKSYKPVFDCYQNVDFPNRKNGWKVYDGNFVTIDSGTGVVHIAPAFGEDDMNLGRENNLPFVQHVNRDGTFKSEVVDFAGQKVKPKEDHQKADVEIIKYLAKKDVLFAKEKIVHSYPHCWRCNTPLLNYATTSWFINVTKIKDRLVEINKNISWTPKEIGEGRFGKWLEGARDWNISRSRYWGAPIPVWETPYDGVSKEQTGERFVCGSINELKERIKSNKNHFIILRHGQAESNLSGVVSAKVEDSIHLTERGKKEIAEISEKFSNINIGAIYSSPFLRTKESAEIIANKIGLESEKIIFDERIAEYGFGDFQGKKFQDFLDYEEKYMKEYETPVPNGESYLDSKKRFGEFLYDIDSKHKNQTILVVTHGIGHEVLEAVIEGADSKRSKYLIDNSNYDTGSLLEFDFVPIPHNENYELDLHRPYIDEIVVMDSDGKRELKRVPEVFDTWYDSGSMPFAQQNYPLENEEEFDKENSSFFPADFIAEGLDQTRGWFYTLLVLSVGLFDKSPYKHVLVNGLVLAEDGRKMSKSLKNYPDLMEVIDKYGADVLRFYLVSSPLVKAEDFNFSEKGVDEVSKKLVLKVHNILSLYEMYPAIEESQLKETILDRWINTRLNELAINITNHLDKYELDKASRPILDFVDDLSTWYVRRSRERLKSNDQKVSLAASHYLRLVLLEFSKLIAPFTPFLAEEIYKKVGGEKKSVHLEDWPKAGEVDTKVLEDMIVVREIVTKALELRQKSGHKVRQPLKSLKIKNQKSKFEEELVNIIKDEINVKEVVFDENIEALVWLDTNITEDLKEEGIARDFIRGIQDARKNEGLNPSQGIELVVNANENIEKIINLFDNMIKIPTQTQKITFADVPQKHEFGVSDSKVSITINIK
ncbi:MAG: class I tRNA ligase family protein [Minisyncoccia bacterium]